MTYTSIQTMVSVESYKDRANVIRDITQVLEGHLNIDNFTINELKDVMYLASVY